MVSLAHGEQATSSGAPSGVTTAVEADCERVLFASSVVLLGEFRCPVHHPNFRGAGRIRNHVVAFPRRAVWIEREGDAPFVADPTQAVLHAPGREYRRDVISPDGDQTDWIAVSEPLVREIVDTAPFSLVDGAQLMSRGRAPLDNALYRAQRTLFRQAGDATPDLLALEETAIGIASATILASCAATRATAPESARTRRLAEDAKALLATTFRENLGVDELARRLAVSPYHLCRSFRASVGMTLHGYRRTLRLREAMQCVDEHEGQLSHLALSLGFSSHAHLSAAFREAFGVTPSTQHLLARPVTPRARTPRRR